MSDAGVRHAAFQTALPIWPEGREPEMNLFVGFRAVVEPAGKGPVILRLTASSLYRASVNGRFVGYGPARGPHGWFRVDEWDITARLDRGRNVVAVEVAGYNVNGFYTLDVPSFLQAEIVHNGKVLAATRVDDTFEARAGAFQAHVLDERVQRVQRYSFMRAFIEAYRLAPGYDAWKMAPDAAIGMVRCAVQPADYGLLPRGVSYPRFDVRTPKMHVARGTLRTGIPVENPWRDRSLVNIGPQFKGYAEDELEFVLSTDLQSVARDEDEPIGQGASPTDRIILGTNAYHILDFGVNLTGFIGATVECQKPTRFLVAFDELLRDGDVDFKRLGCVNAVQYELAPGTHEIETFEAYTLRYAKLFVLDGMCGIEDVHLREYANPDAGRGQFSSSDPRLDRLFEAGRDTFRQNAVDLFMDCPSRERGGWLCDSFFTARVERALTGGTRVERNVFENYLLPERFAFMPDGMLPMCYPADVNDGVFIPNWALWFVVQLDEYLARSADRATVDALRDRVFGLFDYFRPFINSDGLLERLESWIFIEWSKANEFVRDVSYPTNMLYAAALAAAGRMYGRPELVENAARMRRTIGEQSFDGEFFVDNAVREAGAVRPTHNRTETCQYYAFYFDVASPETHAALWRTLCEQFGPRRRAGAHPDVHPSNAFIGLMLRTEILSRAARTQQLLDEAIAWLLPQAELTGTLWENVHDEASCNHGFASHIVHVLYRDALGLYHVDVVRKAVILRFTDLALTSCEGRTPTPDGDIALRWTKDARRLTYTLDTPPGYAVDVQNPDGLTLVRQG